MERSSSGQEPTHLPRWEEVALRKSSERLADVVLCPLCEISPGIGWRADYMQPLLLRSVHEDTS